MLRWRQQNITTHRRPVHRILKLKKKNHRVGGLHLPQLSHCLLWGSAQKEYTALGAQTRMRTPEKQRSLTASDTCIRQHYPSGLTFA